MGQITRVDFRTKTILATKPAMSAPICTAYKRIAGMVKRPARILEAVGEPVDVNIHGIFPEADHITRFAYGHSSRPELSRRYLSLLPASSNYELVILTHLVEEWAHIPHIMLHRWPEFLLASLESGACIMHNDAPLDVSTYARVTFNIAFKEVEEFKEADLTVIVGRDLR